MELNNSHCYWTPKEMPDALNRFVCELPKEVDLQVGELIEITTSIEGMGNEKRVTGVRAIVAFKIYNEPNHRFEYWLRNFDQQEEESFVVEFFGPIDKLATYS